MGDVRGYKMVLRIAAEINTRFVQSLQKRSFKKHVSMNEAPLSIALEKVHILQSSYGGFESCPQLFLYPVCMFMHQHFLSLTVPMEMLFTLVFTFILGSSCVKLSRGCFNPSRKAVLLLCPLKALHSI